MPTISFSQDFIQTSSTTNNLIGRVLSFNAAGAENSAITGMLTYQTPDSFPNLTGSFGAIYVMKGSVPTSNSFPANFDARSSDVLISFQMGTAAQGESGRMQEFSPTLTTYYLNPAVISTNFVTASATGTASWFWFVNRNNDRYGATAGLNQQIIGTVGGVNSGADLEIASTSIVSGQMVRLINLMFTLPITFTF